MQPNDNRPEGLYGVIRGLVRGPVHAMMGHLYGETAGRPAEFDVLEYVGLLEYAAARRVEHPEIAATLIRRERTANAWQVTQVFLDRDNQLIHRDQRLFGRLILARAFDEELAELFDDAESVTIELP